MRPDMKLISLLVLAISFLASCAPTSGSSRSTTIAEPTTKPARYIYWMGDEIDTDTQAFHSDDRLGVKPNPWFDPKTTNGPVYEKTTARPMMVFILTGARATMHEPLCQPITSMVLTDVQAWGPNLYQNRGSSRNVLFNQIAQLIDRNCAPDTVKAINLAVYLNWEHPTRISQGMDGKFAYRGTILITDKDFRLLHHDPEGMVRYSRYNGFQERYYQARIRREKIREGWTASPSYSFRDYCSKYSEVCLGIGAFAAASTLSQRSTPQTETSINVRACLAGCQIWGASYRNQCEAQCYN